jgi:hypothetical protein
VRNESGCANPQVLNPAFHGSTGFIRGGHGAAHQHTAVLPECQCPERTTRAMLNIHGHRRWFTIDWSSSYLFLVTYPPAPTTFEDLIRLIPQRGVIAKRRLVSSDKRFELRIDRNGINVAFLTFGVPLTNGIQFIHLSMRVFESCVLT